MSQILIIEDNAANLDLMGYLLTSFGHEVVTASDGEAGLEAAREKRPTLIVCDVQMPKLDGFAVVRALREDPALARTTVVAVTAFAMVGDREKILGAGFDGYIAKPIAPETFVQQINLFLPQSERSSRSAPATSPCEPWAKPETVVENRDRK